MNSTEITPTADKTASRRNRLPLWITNINEPHSSIKDITTRRQVQLSMSVSLAVGLINIVGIFGTASIIGFGAASITIILFVAGFLLTYVLGKSRWYRTGLLLLPLFVTLITLAGRLNGVVTEVGGVFFTAIALILTSVLLSTRWLAILTLAVALGVPLGLYLSGQPDLNFSFLGRESFFNIAVGTLLFVTTRFRNRVESERLEEVRAVNRELDNLRAELETRVADRTEDLNRRATQVRTAAEVGSAAASLRDIDVLMNEAVRLISERFGYYHVGIFLLDERAEYAVLHASNSPGGQRMLARGHRLQVGTTGIVGYVTGKGEARIALDVGVDAVFFDNPDLPATRSEIALPLRAGDRIVGALDVQSTAPSAFSQEDIATLRILADQIAVAIENARLLAEGRRALEAERRAYGDLSRAAWERLSAAGGSTGYLSTGRGSLTDIKDPIWSPALQEAVRVGEMRLDKKTNNLVIPLKVRDVTIGAIRLQKPEDRDWTDNEIQTVQTLAEQMGVALESARQYQETQSRAERERQINLVAGQVRSAISTENILQNTIRELGKALGASRTFIQLVTENEDENGAGKPGKLL